MNVRELIEILKDFPEDQEVELAIVAPVGDDDDIAIDRYPVDGVLPWEDPDDDESVVWLVGGEEGDVEAFLDAIDEEEDEE
ncbi:MAG TPA: hypothetical protein VF855_12550 [Acidimicrobiales bacterium]